MTAAGIAEIGACKHLRARNARVQDRRMTTTTTTRWFCDCGRGFGKRAGMLVHGRTCPVERARSAAFVRAIEDGRDPHAAAAAVAEATR